ncbi:XrtX-associated membrane protein [Hymenobacter metallicola]|uniref:Uncharacterized protein n=1 Tax=Hymenobacter metallicola TaxID=2563114 RepID=A0A4Z0QCT8_9BACT|nr:hypothetical protein [Hymenobacter metallicola]TGE27296.1 hypothetical protein E5K02_12960 [Hymenobacter metallicola]
MPTSPTQLQPSLPRQSGRTAELLRWAVAAVLVVALFSIGIYSDTVLAAIDRFWHNLLGLLGLAGHAATVQQGISGLVTKRSLISVITYALFYTSTCLLLLVVALNSARRIRLVFVLYGAVFVICAVLVLTGKLAGDVAWAYKLARRLIDFIVSPLPVIILVPLLRWYVPARS